MPRKTRSWLDTFNPNIVLLHIGIGGLMLNEIYVTVTNVEQRMMIEEGQTVSEAVDIRAREFVVIDRSDPKVDRMTVIPVNQLKEGVTISRDQRRAIAASYIKDRPAARAKLDALGPVLELHFEDLIAAPITSAVRLGAFCATPKGKVAAMTACVEPRSPAARPDMTTELRRIAHYHGAPAPAAPRT